MRLTFKKFKLIINDVIGSWYSYKFQNNNGFEITLEPCFDGFCVGIYNQHERLMQPKKCTKLGDILHPQSKIKALKFANEFYKKYKNA